MKQTIPYKIDSRVKEDLYAQIEEFAASYTPEWVFSPNNPDLGSVIAMLFAEQLEGSIDRFNSVIEKYRVELVNLLNISLLPAYPSEGICVMNPLQDTIPGIDVPAGVKLLGDSELSENAIIFETQEPLHVTSAHISDIIEVSGCFGRILPIRGDAAPIYPTGIPAPPPPDVETGDQTEIRLFDFEKKGIESNSLLLYHGDVFDVPPGTSAMIEVFSPDGAPLAKALADSERYRFSYYDGEDFADYSEVTARENVLYLRREGEAEKVSLPDGRLCDVVRIDANGIVREDFDIGQLSIHSSAENIPADFINNNDSDLPTDTCMPFGETASIFDDCYIGNDNIFSHGGAEVTLRFSLDFREKLVTFTPEQEEKTLKVVKRKPRRIQFTTAHTCIERIAVEYFNGIGWRRLIDDAQWTSIFSGEVFGEIELKFTCPNSWEPVNIGANTGRCIRLRIESADNCYLQPCVHRMPVIHGLSISYRYNESKTKPVYAERISGADKTDITDALLRAEAVAAFHPIKYVDNSLYIGFNKKVEGTPLSLYFETRDKVSGHGPALRFEYSTRRGFGAMRVIDETCGFSKSGVIIMEFGEDFSRHEVEGLNRYWIRVTDADGVFDDPNRMRPVITNILPNAVTIRNEQTLDEEDYYIDEAMPNMAFVLTADNILSAEVYVNEINLPRAEIQRMLMRSPENVRVTYDRRGDISEFYVRWQEVENFDASTSMDRHYVIDRLHSAILFGDGVNVRIPEASSDPAFTVKLKRCDGNNANLMEGEINGIQDRILYLGDVYNPFATSGGRDMESVSAAVDRGACMLNSGGRLVSEADYVREAENFSDMVGRAHCIIEEENEAPGLMRKVHISLLMRDYVEGSWSFDNIRDRLKSSMLCKCEATLTAEHIEITEPLFVTINVDVWVYTKDTKRRFEIAALIREMIAERLEPLPKEDSNGNRTRGWFIGELPTAEQIDILLHGIRENISIKRLSATVTYVDADGMHTCELGELQKQPFMIGINGQHKVHFV
ncbi:MAG: hypothetical protein LBQ21_00700 [Clostridiales Family XIII bacterium]|jgi:hypothetical protein|nr:hypothetical protein [Clostridiales Family XIII bacterium]